MSKSTPSIIRIDHGVIPTNDLGKSLSFFTDVLGDDSMFLVNVNLRGLNREVPEIAFFTLANHRGFGLSLEDQPIPPPIRPLEGPVWGFEVDDRGLAGVIEALDRRKVAFEGPVEYAKPSPLPRPSSYEISMISITSFRCVVTDKSALTRGQGD